MPKFEAIGTCLERARVTPVAHDYVATIEELWRFYGQPEAPTDYDLLQYDPVFADAETFGEGNEYAERAEQAYNAALVALLATIGIQRAPNGSFVRPECYEGTFVEYADQVELLIEGVAEREMLIWCEMHAIDPANACRRSGQRQYMQVGYPFGEPGWVLIDGGDSLSQSRDRGIPNAS